VAKLKMESRRAEARQLGMIIWLVFVFGIIAAVAWTVESGVLR